MTRPLDPACKRTRYQYGTGRRSVTTTITLLPDERAALDAHARAAGISRSSWLARLIRAAAGLPAEAVPPDRSVRGTRLVSSR